ncbi:ABC transporter ATP-binding protein [Vallitalea okinawensis]|uniref:ABC transporter ATP-binding protein n=1 Tax=Vallitalea okinawensis TaxID=2078660 RepID=UPI000CFCBE3E|nr:ABC transporter ATP-binding protein [Vallitalea okinawensis]
MKSIICMLRYLKPYKAIAILGPLFILFGVGMDLLQPYLMTLVLDNGIAVGDMSYVIKVGSAMILVALLGAGSGIISTVFSSKAAMNLGADIRSDLFKKVQSLSAKNIDKFKAGKLITRLTNDITQVQMIVFQLLRTFVRAPFLLVGAISLAYITSPELSKTLIVIVPVLILGLVIVIKFAYPYFRKMQDKLDNVNTVLLENMAGIRVIKAFVTSNHENKRFKRTNDDYMDIAIKANRIISLIFPVIMVTIYFGQAAIIGLGGTYAINNIIEVSAIMAFINYLMQILMALMMVAMILMNLSRAEASARRINEVFTEEPDIQPSADNIKNFQLKGNIEFKNVSFAYKDQAVSNTLNHISFKVNTGETIGIIGSTGSGKSTLVKLLPRLYDVNDGDILFDGRSIGSLDIKELRQQIGFVTQKAIIFSGTVADNIKQGKANISMEDMEAAAMKAQSYEYISQFEKKYEHELTQMGTNLSGGQKQRLSLTRAFVREPAILILDDSTSAVDAHSEEKIQKGLKQMGEDTTVIIIAQKISSLLDADKIVVLDDLGNMDGFGTHKELLESSDVYRDIYLSQYGEEALDDAK